MRRTKDTYEAALERAEAQGISQCDDAAAVAAFCKTNLPLIVGAVSPKLVWQGAQVKGLTLLELGRLAGSDPMEVEALQWL